MKQDNLMSICSKLKIKLIYTNNKVLLLSSKLDENIPIMRAHKLFKNCDELTSEAIINYYTGLETNKTEKYIEIINDYIQKNISNENFQIQTPSSDFISFFANKLQSLEANIIAIKADNKSKSFSSSGNSFKIDDDDIKEIEIIVEPFNT